VRRIPFGTLALVGSGLLAALVFYAAVTPSGDFLFVPNTASPAAPKITVEGHPDADQKGGIYFVDVIQRDARWIERIFPFLRPDGSTIVPGQAIAPHGESYAQRRAASQAQMQRSELIASAVALKAAGKDVKIVENGVLISSIAIDVPAARALEEGDVIVEAAGRPTLTPADLREAVNTVKPGESIELKLRRGDTELTRVVKTVRSPADGRTLIGITPEQDADIVLPLKVNINLGDVGGPSAGLPFALEVLQELGHDVDRGYKVAATGEILLDGTVAPVGGLKQKTIGVKKAGADLFLVPAGENAAEARRYAGTLRIVPVESFQQALRFLKTLPEK
jgi:PDZ domain-containing protein